MMKLKTILTLITALIPLTVWAEPGQIQSHRFNSRNGETISDFPLAVDGAKFTVRKNNDSGDILDIDFVNSRILLSGEMDMKGNGKFGDSVSQIPVANLEVGSQSGGIPVFALTNDGHNHPFGFVPLDPRASFAIVSVDDPSGGTLIGTTSGPNSRAIEFNAWLGSANPLKEAFLFQAWKTDGFGGTIDLGPNEEVLRISNGSTLLSIFGNGEARFQGHIQLGNGGTAMEPAISFSGVGGTGIFHPQPGVVSLASSGNEAAAFSHQNGFGSFWTFSNTGLRLRDTSNIEYISFSGFGTNWIFGTNISGVQFNQKVGFFSANPAVKQNTNGVLTNNVAGGGVDGVIADFNDLNTYANDAATIRNDIYQLSKKLKAIDDALRTYGLVN